MTTGGIVPGGWGGSSKHIDLDCLDEMLATALSPAPCHAASASTRHGDGIFDRNPAGLDHRDPSDRRAAFVRALRDRNAEIDLVASFLRRTTDAGRAATNDLVRD